MEENYRHKFSIIIGAYNHSKTIGKLAESINSQTYTDFDIHLCDDGSTDDTRYVFEKNLHPIFRKRLYYHRQENKGMRLSKNINQGIKEATGEYCVFVMGDSFMELDYLRSFEEFAKPNRILCGIRLHIDQDVAVDVDWRLKKAVVPPANVLLPSDPFNMITGNGLVIPTDALHKYGGWDETIQGYGGDDQEIVGRLYYKGYLVYSIYNAKLYHHWHPSGITKEGNEKYVLKKVREYYHANKL